MVRGVFTFLLHWQRPDRVPVRGRGVWMGSARWRIRSLSSRSQFAVACSRHLFNSISLKGNTGANQSSEPQLLAACTGHPGDLSSAGGLGSLPPLFFFYNIASQLSGMWLASFSSLPPATTLANCHKQVPSDGSLTSLLRRDLILALHPPITHIPSDRLSLVVLTPPLGLEGQCEGEMLPYMQ